MPKSDTTRQKPLPQCKAFLLCERVAQDDATGQLTLHKLIEVLQFPAFPADSIPFVVFVQLYDGIGRYQLAIEIRDLVGDTSIRVALLSNLEFPERLAKMDLVLPIEFVRLPREGRYEFAVVLDGEELASQPINAELSNGRESA